MAARIQPHSEPRLLERLETDDIQKFAAAIEFFVPGWKTVGLQN
jgi:hypothetical protein